MIMHFTKDDIAFRITGLMWKSILLSLEKKSERKFVLRKCISGLIIFTQYVI